jgi:hypothetical protein
MHTLMASATGSSAACPYVRVKAATSAALVCGTRVWGRKKRRAESE